MDNLKQFEEKLQEMQEWIERENQSRADELAAVNDRVLSLLRRVDRLERR